MSSRIIAYIKQKLSKTVLDYSKKVNADLVMIMTQQESEFNLYFLVLLLALL